MNLNRQKFWFCWNRTTKVNWSNASIWFDVKMSLKHVFRSYRYRKHDFECRSDMECHSVGLNEKGEVLDVCLMFCHIRFRIRFIFFFAFVLILSFVVDWWPITIVTYLFANTFYFSVICYHWNRKLHTATIGIIVNGIVSWTGHNSFRSTSAVNWHFIILSAFKWIDYR